MAVDFSRGSGIITAVSVASGAGSQVQYGYAGTWIYPAGGGDFKPSGLFKPVRPFSDSDNVKVSKAAGVGDPCEFTLSPDGTIRLFTPTEEWETTPCE